MYNYPVGSWKTPERLSKDVVEVKNTRGATHRFVDAEVKKILVEDEEWYTIRSKDDGRKLYHFPVEIVTSITVDGLPYEG